MKNSWGMLVEYSFVGIYCYKFYAGQVLNHIVSDLQLINYL
jgi:hypothetical protein